MEKAKIKDFGPKLQALCAKTLASNRSQESAGEMIEALTSALSFTIAVATGGNPKAINEMCEGVSGYLFEQCAEKRRAGEAVGQFMKG